MSPGKISGRVGPDGVGRIKKSIMEIESVPLGDCEAFASDKRNVWSAESC